MTTRSSMPPPRAGAYRTPRPPRRRTHAAFPSRARPDAPSTTCSTRLRATAATAPSASPALARTGLDIRSGAGHRPARRIRRPGISEYQEKGVHTLHTKWFRPPLMPCDSYRAHSYDQANSLGRLAFANHSSPRVTLVSGRQSSAAGRPLLHRRFVRAPARGGNFAVRRTRYSSAAVYQPERDLVHPATGAPESTTFKVGEYLEIHGQVEPERFEAAVRRTVAEAEPYNVRFGEDGGAPWQISNPCPTGTSRYLDVGGAPESAGFAGSG